MDDLISRQAAIDAIIEDKICDDSLKIMIVLGEGDKAETLNMTCDRHAKMLMSLPSAQPERRWIPCSERLPETDEFVLVSLSGRYKNIGFEHSCEIADYADGEWFINAYPFMMAETANYLIEAWMPLPELYKGETE